MFFAPGRRKWSFEKWSSDAEFLYCREDRSGIKTIGLCNGCQVTFDGRQVLSAQELIQCCEITSPERQVISRQKDIIKLGCWPKTKAEEAAGRLEPATVKAES
jgi:hypothetical protein